MNTKPAMSDSKFDPQKSSSYPASDRRTTDGGDLPAANDDSETPVTTVDAVRFWLRLVGLP